MIVVDIFLCIVFAFCKLCRRVWIRIKLGCIESIKDALMYEKQRITRPRGACCDLFHWTLVAICSILLWLRQMVCSVVGFFIATDQFSSYLSLMRKEGSRENKLWQMTLFYLFGTLFSIAVFYTEVLFLGKFDNYSLINCLLILVVCTFFPLFSVLGRAVALLVIPTSAITTLRACILAFIFINMNLIAWSNVNDNFDNTMDAIVCEKNVIHKFIKGVDFRLAATDEEIMNSKGDRTVISLVPQSSNWFVVAKAVDMILFGLKMIYRTIAWIFYTLHNLIQIVVTFLQENAIALLEYGNVLGMSIGGNVGHLISWIMKLLQDIINKTPTSFNFLDLTPLISLRSTITVRYKPDFVYKVHTIPTKLSFHAIFRNAKDKVIEEHFYIAYVESAVKWLMELYLVYALFKIYGGAISYLVLFLNVRGYDNYYLTPQFFEYDQKRQKACKGLASLFPLYLYERLLYVERTDPHLTSVEWAHCLNVMVANLNVFYGVFLFIVDYAAYSMALFTKKWIEKIAANLHTYPSILRESTFPPIRWLFENEKFVTDFENLRGSIKACAPRPHDLEWPMYMTGLVLMILWWVLLIGEPYLRRTRSYVCERLFSHRIEPRMQWLYSNIILTRIVTKLVVNAINPALGRIMFMKQGITNVFRMKSAAIDANEAHLPNQQDIIAYFNIWPMNCIFKYIGLIEPLPTCVKCKKEISNMRMFKCPNWSCNSFYGEDCYQNFQRCIQCNTFIRQDEEESEQQSEESDSSADYFN